MSYCSECGTQLSDGMNFCPKCGQPCSNVSSQSAEACVVKQKKSSKISSKALLLVILVIAIIAGGWFAWKNQGDDYSLEGLAKALPNYDIVGDFHCGRAYVIKYVKNSNNDVEWRRGYIDKKGNEIIPCIYLGDEMTDYDFHEGLAAVSKDGKYSYIDVDGNEIAPFIYDAVCRFSEGYAVARRDERFYIINTSGKELVELKYGANLDVGESNYFSEGLFPVWEDNKYGFVNIKGELVIPCEYTPNEEGAYPFSDGLAIVYNGEKYGYIDKTGKEVIPLTFDEATDFSEGLAAVEQDYKWFYINKKGEKVMNTNFPSGFRDGIAINTSEDGQNYYYVNKSGEKVIDNEYHFATLFDEGYARVCKKIGDEYLNGIIDKKGKEVIPCRYKSEIHLSEGLVLINDDDSYGFVDLHGRSTFDLENEEVKQLVQQKKKEREEEEERERKRIEEEKRRYEEEYGATAAFYKAIQGINAWEQTFYKQIGRTLYYYYTILYFYPITKTKGRVSIVDCGDNGSGGYLIFDGSKKSMYEIIDDVIYIDHSFTNFATNKTITLELKIENQGSIKLCDKGTGWNFIRSIPKFKDPLK